MSLRAEAAAEAGVVREVPVDAEVPLYAHPGWRAEFPWLAQGVSARSGTDAFDLSLFGDTPAGLVQERWRRLRVAAGVQRAVHARQVHGARVLVHEGVTAAGLLVLDDADGHATASAGLLLTVSVADCVPVSLVDPQRRALALLHAGWRGVVAGILENGVAVLRERFGCAAGALRMHLGPAICGACYEVGPEVHTALGVGRPSAPAPVDLRGVLALRARGLGLSPENVSVSGLCTRHDVAFHSHRGGARERQVAVLGARDADAAAGGWR